MKWIFLSLAFCFFSGAEACACAKTPGADYEQLDTARSKFVQSAAYGAMDHCLRLTLEGTPVRHCNVPISVWRSFKTAKDLGLYYNLNIQGRYACTNESAP